MVLTVHHLQVSQSERIVWLCEELGIDYDLKNYKRNPVFSPPEYVALHPIGSAPVIEDGAVKIAESEACTEYIINTRGSQDLAVKPGAENYADYLYWYYFANGSLQPGLSKVLAIKMSGVVGDHPGFQRYQSKFDQYVGFMNDRLSQVPYLAGQEFTMADIMPVFTLTTMRQFLPVDLSKYEHVLAWLKRVTSREAYQRAMKKGDPQIDISDQIQGHAPRPFPAMASRQKM